MSNKEVREYLKGYQDFVESRASEPSSDLDKLVAHMYDLRDQGCKVPELLTSSEGLGAEAGEYTEIVKKILFQGKPYDADNIFHMKRELGDVCFYLMVACNALNLDLDDIIDENVRKLEARYPDGFKVEQSEVRKDGDL